jgi:hypothetical protein
MQSKLSVPKSNPDARGSRPSFVKTWGAALVPLAAVLALGSASTLLARTATAPVPAPVAPVAPAGLVFGHPANADQDVGPGSAESVLAQHP